MSSPPVNTPSRPMPAASVALPPKRFPPVTPEKIWGGVWALAALLLSAYAFKRLYPGDLTDGDAMDYAQIARNIANGHGYATGILRPLALSGFVAPDPQAGNTAPDVSRAPLYPFALMLAFVAHGGHGGGNVVVLASLLFFLAGAAAVYFLARAVFPAEGQPWAALLSAGLYVLGGTALGYATAGTPVSLATLVVSLFLIALFRSHEVGGRPVPSLQVLGVGALLGLCYLAQFSLLMLLPTTLAYVFATRAPARAWAGVGACAFGFLLVTLPWLVRTALVTHGSPFFTLLQYGLLADTPGYPGQSSIYRSVLPAETPFSFFFSHLPDMARKAGRGLAYYQGHLAEAFPTLLLAPALASLLWRFPDIRVGVLRGYVAASVSLLAVATTVFSPSTTFLAPFAPAVTVIGVGFVFQIMSRQQWQPISQRIVLWVWGGLVGLGLVAALVGRPPLPPNLLTNGLRMLATPENLQPRDPQGVSHAAVAVLKAGRDGSLLRSIRSGAVITDTPWEAVWRANQTAVWLPRDNQAYEAVVGGSGGRGGVPAPSLLLTPNIAAYGRDDAAPWIALARDPQALERREQNIRAASRIPLEMRARFAAARRLLAAHDPRFRLTAAQLNRQIAEATAATPALVKNRRDQVRSDFDAAYGPISQVLADYGTVPNVLQQAEANGTPSTLFVRRRTLAPLRLSGGTTR